MAPFVGSPSMYIEIESLMPSESSLIFATRLFSHDMSFTPKTVSLLTDP